MIIPFPVFIQLYTQQWLNQIETVPVPIVNRNKQANSYTHLQIDRPYIALNSETYISIRQQELLTCKKIGYEFYCEELFMVKHKSKNSSESVIYFNLGPDIIKENCKIAYYFNKTNITPTVLGGDNKIILANWPDDKHIICNVNNDIPVKIPRHPYVLVNTSVLCICGIEVENNFFESSAACHNVNSKLVMYFKVNTAFVNYFNSLENLTDSVKTLNLLNRMTYEQTLPISLPPPKFDSKLLTTPKMLKDFVHQIHQKKEIFDLQERHTHTELEMSNKHFFFNNYILDVFLFVTAIISLLVTTLVINILCKYKKLKTLVSSLVFSR